MIAALEISNEREVLFPHSKTLVINLSIASPRWRHNIALMIVSTIQSRFSAVPSDVALFVCVNWFSIKTWVTELLPPEQNFVTTWYNKCEFLTNVDIESKLYQLPTFVVLLKVVPCLAWNKSISQHTASVATFTKEVNPRLVKRKLETNGLLANPGVTSVVKGATGVLENEAHV